ncbi:MAG: hypothetical protein KIH01_04360 [Candidatus Freyarchaeota archaeon]|nr:hypothetical protein [Candidatus Jordarchaeia archaeon]
MSVSVPKYVLMVKVEPGDKSPIPFSRDVINSDSLVVLIDELDDRLYLWMGKNRSLVDKRAAMRVAQSIMRGGFSYGKLQIGRSLRELVEIDESKLSESDVKEKFEALNAVFKRPYTVKDKMLVEVAVEAPSSVRAPAPQVEEAVVAVEAPQAPIQPAKEATLRMVAPSPPSEAVKPAEIKLAEVEPELVGRAKLGLLFTLLAEEFPELLVNYKVADGVPAFEFESPEGLVARVSIDGKDLVISYGSTFAEKRDKVVSRLKEIIGKILG